MAVADLDSAWGNRPPNRFENSDFAPVWGGFPFLCAFWRNKVIVVRQKSIIASCLGFVVSVLLHVAYSLRF